MTMPDPRDGGRDNMALGTEQVLPGTAKESSSEGAGGGAREQVRQAKDKVVDQARTTLREARERAGSTLSQGRYQAADQLGGLGGAFHRTGETLRQEDQARFADVADTVGRQLDRVAGYLRESDGRTIARDLENMARRQPALVFAGAFALGILAARFLKSSSPRSEFEEDEGYGRVYPGGEPAGLGGYSSYGRGEGGYDDRP
jgi:hypothetical protein